MPAQRSNWSLYPASPTFGVGLADTYLIGAALGVLDYAGLYHLDHPVQQNTSGIWSIAKSSQFPAELIGLTLAGAVVGVASGYFAHQLNSPFILGLLPGGFYMGMREGFQ